jgi:predicted GTPase
MATTAQKKKFKPLRMTIMGCGGTGKSVLINTLVTCIRKIFDDNDSVFVTAPTGAAAYNVGGSTIHREFKINVRDVPGYNTTLISIILFFTLTYFSKNIQKNADS